MQSSEVFILGAGFTLNYDTLIERVASSTYWHKRSDKIPTDLLYPIDLTPAQQRSTTILRAQPMDTFRLFKLHGSINWLYSGSSKFYGEELYCVPCIGGLDGLFDSYSGVDHEKSHWSHTNDKVALIIPPVLDKAVFFQHESLRLMWFQASQAIKKATRIVCMGYSLPSSDLTMAQFLKTSATKDKIPFEILNRAPMRDHFSEILGGDTFDFKQDDEIDENCIPRFVIKQCVSGDKDKLYVAALTHWKKGKE